MMIGDNLGQQNNSGIQRNFLDDEPDKEHPTTLLWTWSRNETRFVIFYDSLLLLRWWKIMRLNKINIERPHNNSRCAAVTRCKTEPLSRYMLFHAVGRNIFSVGRNVFTFTYDNWLLPVNIYIATSNHQHASTAQNNNNEWNISYWLRNSDIKSNWPVQKSTTVKTSNWNLLSIDNYWLLVKKRN